MAEKSNVESNVNDQELSGRNGVIELSIKELGGVVSEIQRLRGGEPAGIFASKIAEDTTEISQQIIKVVAMRKDMEKVLEIEALQSTHSSTISQLIDRNINLQGHSALLEETIKRIQNGMIASRLQEAKRQSEPTLGASFHLGTQLKDILGQFKQSISMEGHLRDETGRYSDEEKDIEQFTWQDTKNQQILSQKQEDQRQKAESSHKRLYRTKFQELLFRDQLISERENIFYNYQASNNELIDTLLSRKEKDNILQKTQKQKYDHYIKQRHQNDVQLEQLAFSQSNLISLYENDLVNLKKKVKDMEKSQDDALNAKKSIDEMKASFQLQVRKLNENKSVLEAEVSRLDQQLGSYKDNESKLIDKSQSLQSQLNESILKMSHLSKLKQQMSEKIDKKQKKYQKLQNSTLQLQKKLEEKKDDLKQLQQRAKIEVKQMLRINESTVLALQRKVDDLEEQLSYQSKSNNQQRNALKQKIKEQEQHIKIFQSKQKDGSSKDENSGQLSESQLERLRDQILLVYSQQLQKNSHLIDKAANQISNLFVQ